MQYNEQELANRLLKLLSDRSVVQGYSRGGGRSGAVVTVSTTDNGIIQAIAVGSFPPGDCLAIRDPDSGEWFAYSVNAGQVVRSQSYRRQARIRPQITASTVAYIADTENHAIRRIDIVRDRWSVSTLAGNGTPGSVDGDRATARFFNPFGVVATKQAIYVADTSNQKIRKVSFTGRVSTIHEFPVGTNPLVLATEGGVIYVGSSGSNEIWRIAGDVAGLFATMPEGRIEGICIGSDGNLYAIANNRNFYRISLSDSSITKIYEVPFANFSPAYTPISSGGKLYFGLRDNNNLSVPTRAKILSINLDGSGQEILLDSEFGSFGETGVGDLVSLVFIKNLLHVVDQDKGLIYRLQNGGLNLIAGNPSSRGFVDGVGVNAQFLSPYQITLKP